MAPHFPEVKSSSRIEVKSSEGPSSFSKVADAGRTLRSADAPGATGLCTLQGALCVCVIWSRAVDLFQTVDPQRQGLLTTPDTCKGSGCSTCCDGLDEELACSPPRQEVPSTPAGKQSCSIYMDTSTSFRNEGVSWCLQLLVP